MVDDEEVRQMLPPNVRSLLRLAEGASDALPPPSPAQLLAEMAALARAEEILGDMHYALLSAQDALARRWLEAGLEDPAVGGAELPEALVHLLRRVVEARARVLHFDPELPNQLEQLGRMLFMLGREDEALACHDRVTELVDLLE
ncbi:MAG TPA: hypothetical protein VJB16_01315 [archaeon]|nr:hypothetical protein [archaeon]